MRARDTRPVRPPRFCSRQPPSRFALFARACNSGRHSPYQRGAEFEVQLADDGDHFRLAFDVPGSWSQKYNLVWGKQKTYGLPLDSRKLLTKLDWLVWTASLTESAADFELFLRPAWRFVNETPNRVPRADGHWVEDARQRDTAQARSVVGGVFIRMLAAASRGFTEDFPRGMAEWWVEGGADPKTGTDGNVATIRAGFRHKIVLPAPLPK